jgi:predicted HAD superfamily Cof-like phosphohydrolase
MSKTGYQKVVDFNTCFGSHVATEYDKHLYFSHPNIVNLKYGLVDEEVKELDEAYMENDIVEIIDALCDIKYVLYGMAAAFGINSDVEFKKYLRYTCDKSNTIDNSDFVMVKNLNNDINYDVKNYINNSKNTEFKKKTHKIMSNIILINANLKKAKNNAKFDIMLQELNVLLYHVNLMGITIGVNLDDAFNIVHSSNMSKVCPSEDLAKETVAWYLDNDDRYKTPDYRESDYGWVVFNKDTGKILKSIKYTPADFSTLL